jgi:hypothetical protein
LEKDHLKRFDVYEAIDYLENKLIGSQEMETQSELNSGKMNLVQVKIVKKKTY